MGIRRDAAVLRPHAGAGVAAARLIVLVILVADHRRSTSICSCMVPKGFFPQQDTGRMIGGIQADQSISFQLMRRQADRVRHASSARTRRSPASSVSPAAGRPIPALSSSSLKPLAERKLSVDQVIAPVARAKLAHVAGARLFLQAVQDIRAGGRQSNAHYQYTLQGDDCHRALRVGAEDRPRRWRSCRN